MSPVATSATGASGALHEHLRMLAAGFSIEVTAAEVPAFAERPEHAMPGLEVFVPWPLEHEAQATLAACRLLSEAGYTPVPHVPARAFAKRSDLDTLLERLTTLAGVEKVMLIGGDRPESAGPFAGALEVMATGLLNKHGIREVAVASYPDGHRTIPAPMLRAALAEKIATGRTMGLAVSIVTQFGFEPSSLVEWTRRTLATHPGVPLAIGLPGPARLATLTRYANRCGVAGGLRALAAYRTGAESMLAPVAPSRQLVALATSGLMDAHPRHTLRTHLFGFGSAAHTLAWMIAVQEGRFALSAERSSFTVADE